MREVNISCFDLLTAIFLSILVAVVDTVWAPHSPQASKGSKQVDSAFQGFACVPQHPAVRLPNEPERMDSTGLLFCEDSLFLAKILARV